jgi:hypothetical protein
MSSCLVPIKGLGTHARLELQRRWRSAGSGRYAMTSIANFAPLCASAGHSAMRTRPHFGPCRALRRRETTKHNAFQRQAAQPALRSRRSAEGPWFGGDTSGVLAFLRIGLYANGAPEGALFDLRWPGSDIGLSHPGRSAMRFVLAVATTSNQPPCDCYKRLAIVSYNWSGLYRQRSPSPPCYIVRHNNSFYMRCSPPLDSRPAL